MHPSDSVWINITVPVFNEERALGPSLRKLGEYLLRREYSGYEIVVVNNGSTDNTLSVANRTSEEIPYVRVLNLAAKGRGRALKAAWLNTTAQVLTYMDVDLFPSDAGETGRSIIRESGRKLSCFDAWGTSYFVAGHDHFRVKHVMGFNLTAQPPLLPPMKGSEVAVSPANKIIQGDWSWSSGLDDSSWHWAGKKNMPCCSATAIATASISPREKIIGAIYLRTRRGNGGDLPWLVWALRTVLIQKLHNRADRSLSRGTGTDSASRSRIAWRSQRMNFTLRWAARHRMHKVAMQVFVGKPNRRTPPFEHVRSSALRTLLRSMFRAPNNKLASHCFNSGSERTAHLRHGHQQWREHQHPARDHSRGSEARFSTTLKVSSGFAVFT